MNPTVKSAADLIEDRIRTEAPFYGMETASDLLQRMDIGLIGSRSSLRFPPTKDVQIIDPETQATWQPLSLVARADGWFLGQITMAEKDAGRYFRGLTFKDEEEELIPEMFVSGALIVSARVKDLIAKFAPGCCYFAPMEFRRQSDGAPATTQYFNVMIRTCLYYEGGSFDAYIYPEGRRMDIVRPLTWTAFCMSKAVQDAAASFPIFLFDRSNNYPILSQALLQHLKAAQISGLLEGTERIETEPPRPASYYGFETIFPLDPDYRN